MFLVDTNLLKMLPVPPVPFMETPGGYTVQESREHSKGKMTSVPENRRSRLSSSGRVVVTGAFWRRCIAGTQNSSVAEMGAEGGGCSSGGHFKK